MTIRTAEPKTVAIIEAVAVFDYSGHAELLDLGVTAASLSTETVVRAGVDRLGVVLIDLFGQATHEGTGRLEIRLVPSAALELSNQLQKAAMHDLHDLEGREERAPESDRVAFKDQMDQMGSLPELATNPSQ
jgi:hypothetical protein